MRKTLLLCDSACDLALEAEARLDIRIINCGVEIGGVPYEDRMEVSSQMIYDHVEKTSEVPHTSQVTVISFLEAYLKAAKDGYTDIICATMNAKGSGTNAAAQHAVTLFPEEYPSFAGKVNIYVVDSRTYSLPIVLPLLQAKERLAAGEAPADTAKWLEDYYDHEITVVGLYSLQYAKLSGRLNASAAFVGEVLGLKPIMTITGENKVIDKVRGDRNLIPRLVKLYTEMAADPKGDYIIAYGNNLDQAKELAAAIKKAGGKAPTLMGAIGPCVAINAGPKMLGLGFRMKE